MTAATPATGSAELPACLEEVTREWITQALAGRYPGTVVTSLHVGRVVQAFATNVRLLLEYNDAGHGHRLPATMFLKAGFGQQDLESAFFSAARREVRFYQEVRPHLPIAAPACFFAAADESSGRAVLLLEDILGRNAIIGSPARPLSVESAERGLALLARVHAYWWQHPRLSALELYPGSLEPAVRLLLSPAIWDRALDRPAARWLPGDLRESAAVMSAVELAWGFNRQAPHCFVHGDPHLGNMYGEPDGSLGLLDWQAASSGSWAYDVSRFIVGSLEVEQRRAAERALLSRYLQFLRANGVNAPTFRAAWLEYSRNTVHGLRWLTSPPGHYPDEFIEAYVRRFSAAATDLRALEALR